MSIYFAHDKTPMYKGVAVETTDTVTIWTVTSGHKLTLTGLHISSFGGAAAPQLTFTAGTTNTAPGTTVAILSTAASASIQALAGPLDLDIADNNLYVNSTAGATDGQFVLATGFETKMTSA